MLRQWLIDEYGVELDASAEALGGADLAAAVQQALVRARLGFDRQRAVLRAAAERQADVVFGNACLDAVDAIAAFQRRLADTPVPDSPSPSRRHSAVTARSARPPAPPFAELRFLAAAPDAPELADILDDFARRLVAQGYVENRPDIVRDLRQGLGYYRRGEDPLRLRRTIRWLRPQNQLSHLVRCLLDAQAPICRVPDGNAGRWQVTADIFADRAGRTFENRNFDHARLGDGPARRALEALVPVRVV